MRQSRCVCHLFLRFTGGHSIHVHDWNSVNTGTFHAFHVAWLTHLSEALNGGILLEGYYALPEPRVQRKLSASPTACAARRTLAIRHVSGHRVVALVEILSPANKDGERRVIEFVDKVTAALWQGIHVLLIDLFPPGRFDPQGMPLLLTPDRYVRAPLVTTYLAAHHGLPEYWRHQLNGAMPG
jgi:hypothetical protein